MSEQGNSRSPEQDSLRAYSAEFGATPIKPARRSRGDSILKWGVVIVIGLLFWVQGPMRHFEAQHRVRVSKDQASQRSLAVAIQNYHADHGAFPPTTPMAGFLAGERELAKHGALDLRAAAGLTTPVAYIEAYPRDAVLELPFAYWAFDDVAMLVAPGPDADFDLNERRLPEEARLDPKSFLRTIYFYDPTNGTTSSGDLFKFVPPTAEIERQAEFAAARAAVAERAGRAAATSD